MDLPDLASPQALPGQSASEDGGQKGRGGISLPYKFL